MNSWIFPLIFQGRNVLVYSPSIVTVVGWCLETRNKPWEIVFNLCIIWACSFLKFVQNWIINLRGWSFWSIHRWLWDMCFEYPITFKVFLPAINALHPVSYRKTSISFHPATSFRAQFIHEKLMSLKHSTSEPPGNPGQVSTHGLATFAAAMFTADAWIPSMIFSPYGLFWEDFWNCSESVPFYGTANFRHDFNRENWLENCGFTNTHVILTRLWLRPWVFRR